MWKGKWTPPVYRPDPIRLIWDICCQHTCGGPSTEAVLTMATSPSYCTAGSAGAAAMRRRKGNLFVVGVCICMRVSV